VVIHIDRHTAGHREVAGIRVTHNKATRLARADARAGEAQARVGPLVACGATLTGPATEPLVLAADVALKARVKELTGALFETVNVKAVLPPVMIDAAAGVAMIAPMVASCVRSTAVSLTMRT